MMLMIPLFLMGTMLIWTIGQFPEFWAEAQKSAQYGYLSGEAYQAGSHESTDGPAEALISETNLTTAADKVAAN